jgi:hypothetical protein
MRIRVLPSSSKNSQKILDSAVFCDIFMAIFGGKNTFFLYQFNKKIPILYNLWLQERLDNKFSPLLFCCYSWIKDLGSKIRGSGSGIRDQGSGIRDQGSGVRDQGSGIWEQESGIRDP